MPAVSKKQERFMQAVAQNPKFAKKVGVPQSVGREFTKKEGGEMKESKSMMKKEVSFMKKKGAPKSMIKHEMKEAGMKKGGYASGGYTPSKATGTASFQQAMSTLKGMKVPTASKSSSQTPTQSGGRMGTSPFGGSLKKIGSSQSGGRMGTSPFGGSLKKIGSSLAGKAQPLGSAPLAGKPAPVGRGRGPIKPLPVPPSRMKSGGLAAGHKAADGVAKKGRTVAKQVKMMRGGSCS